MVQHSLAFSPLQVNRFVLEVFIDKAMDSTPQLLNGPNVTSELIGGENGRDPIHSSFLKSDTQAQRVHLGPTFCYRRRLQCPSVNYSCSFGDKRGEGHNHLFPARVSTKSSGEGGNNEQLWMKYFPIQLRDNTINKSEMEQNPYVVNKLLRVYMRCGKLQKARHVFEKLVKKNVVTWTTTIGGYAESGHTDDAVEVYNHMRQEGMQPDDITYLNVLKACGSPAALRWGKEIHADIRVGGFESDIRVQTALVNMYAKSGSIDDARRVFDGMVHRNVISWTAMIGGLAQHGHGHEAFSLFLQMQKEGIAPDATNLTSILSASASAGTLEWVKVIHILAVKTALVSDLPVGNALINAYAKSGSVDDASLVFDGMVYRNAGTWNAMIGGLAQHGCGHEVLFVSSDAERRI